MVAVAVAGRGGRSSGMEDEVVQCGGAAFWVCAWWWKGRGDGGRRWIGVRGVEGRVAARDSPEGVVGLDR
jgi:hypothetical protein